MSLCMPRCWIDLYFKPKDFSSRTMLLAAVMIELNNENQFSHLLISFYYPHINHHMGSFNWTQLHCNPSILTRSGNWCVYSSSTTYGICQWPLLLWQHNLYFIGGAKLSNPRGVRWICRWFVKCHRVNISFNSAPSRYEWPRIKSFVTICVFGPL